MSTPKEHPTEQPPPQTNDQIAARLEEVADLLEAQGANMFRVRAYRTAARNLRGLPRQVQEILDTEGVAGLIKLPGIGHSLAAPSRSSVLRADWLCSRGYEVTPDPNACS